MSSLDLDNTVKEIKEMKKILDEFQLNRIEQSLRFLKIQTKVMANNTKTINGIRDRMAAIVAVVESRQ